MFQYRRLAAYAFGLGLAALLLAVPARAADVDKLLPNDTETVAAINVKQILNSALVKKFGQDKIKEALKSQEMFQKILDDLGFDIFKDLDSILIAGPGGSDTDKGLVIVRGNFDIKKMTTKAQGLAKDMKDVIKAVSVKDGVGGTYDFWEVSPPDAPQSLFVSLASKDTILAAPSKDYLIDAMEKLAGRKKAALKNKDMAGLIGRMDTKQSLYLGVLGDSLKNSPLANEDKAKEIIEKLADASIGLTIEKDIVLEIGITAKGAKEAKDLEDTIKDGLNQLLGIAALLGGNNKMIAPLVDILKTVKPSLKDKTITVKVTVDSETLEKIIPKE